MLSLLSFWVIFLTVQSLDGAQANPQWSSNRTKGYHKVRQNNDDKQSEAGH